MNEPEKNKEIIPAPVDDSLINLSEEEIRKMKAEGKICYPLASSKDGALRRSSDGQVYKVIKGTLTRWPPVAKLSKKQRRAERAAAKEAS